MVQEEHKDDTAPQGLRRSTKSDADHFASLIDVIFLSFFNFKIQISFRKFPENLKFF